MKAKKCIVLALGAVLLAGCSTKNPFRDPNKGVLTERGCEAFNFDTLLLSKGKAVRFIDNRSLEERNYQNGLWTVREYCKMSGYTLARLIAEYGDRTGYTNVINVKNIDGTHISENSPSTVEISGSSLNYSYKTNNFNFVIMRGEEIIYAKEGEIVNLDGQKYRFFNTREYMDDGHKWLITVRCVNDGVEKVLTLDKNKFFLGSYKVMF